MCLPFARNAEIHAYLQAPAEYGLNSIYPYNRYKTHWNFTQHWCMSLTQAPATAELLAMLRVLIENTFFAQVDEIDIQLLKKWLDMVPRVSFQKLP
jgi:hypothetical protein